MNNPDSKKVVSNTEETQDTLLATKLYIPQIRTNFVPRSHLINKLTVGGKGTLTLISAPAGFGKTTLLAEWIHKNEIPVAWVSLDEGDGDQVRFMSYVVAALQKIKPSIGRAALTLLQSPQSPSIEPILTNLINEIIAIPHEFILVLDDYHMVDNKQVHNIVEFLIDHLPQQMKLVIATRSDPPLPLARLRGRNQLNEFRASDLSFSIEETTEFFNTVMTLGLSIDDITKLDSRTEGWIAGLQLAALSMQDREDIPTFIKTFTGDDRHIVDYLAEEVLNRQSEPIRNFLLQTSILDRLTGSLCEAVTTQENGEQILNDLDKSNLFIVPLDNSRNWFRYHHLFADLLRQRLKRTHGDLLSKLHIRASKWYERNGFRDEAINHALVTKDFKRVAGLVELAGQAMLKSRRETKLLNWLKTLPDELIRSQPVLSTFYAWASLLSGQLEAVEPRLRDAERWLKTTKDTTEQPEVPPEEMVVVSEDDFRQLPGSIAVANAFLTKFSGDVSGSMKYSKRALDLLPKGDYGMRGGAATILGCGYWTCGELDAASRVYTDAIAYLHKDDNITFVINVTDILARLMKAQGRLHEAVKTYQQSLQIAMDQGILVRGTADLYVGMSELHREFNDLEAAIQCLQKSKKLGEFGALPENQYRWCVGSARVKTARGDWDGALDLINEAERLFISSGAVPLVRPLPALKIRMWVAQGRLTEAQLWVREQGMSVDDDLSYLREFEHITLVRVLIAMYKKDQNDRYIHEAMALSDRLLKAAENGARTGSVIEILVLKALALQLQHETANAVDALGRAISLAEPGGYVRIFVDEGQPITELLEEILDTQVAVPRTYVKKLLTAMKVDTMQRPKDVMVNQLSQRELEVLQLIEAGCSNAEISEHLFVSLNTVKTHVKNILSKLGVNNRTKAVVKAKQLGLL